MKSCQEWVDRTAPNSESSTVDSSTTRKLDAIIWGLIAIVALIDCVATIVTTFHIVGRTFVPAGATGAGLLIGYWFYLAKRNDPRLSSALGCTAQIMAFAAVGAPLSYVAASAGFPLVDAALDAADKALGFDWSALLSWFNAHPVIFGVLRAIYLSLTFQSIAIVLCLAFTGKLVWLRVFVLTFIIVAVTTIGISAFFPAEGVWQYYGLSKSEDSIFPISNGAWPAYHAIRDGSLRQLVAMGAEGIITFPSLHAALAVIFIAASWPVRKLRWLIAPANLIMLVATPVDGAHYLVDTLAGVAIALASLVVSVSIARQVTYGHSPYWDFWRNPRSQVTAAQ